MFLKKNKKKHLTLKPAILNAEVNLVITKLQCAV